MEKLVEASESQRRAGGGVMWYSDMNNSLGLPHQGQLNHHEMSIGTVPVTVC